MMRVWAWAPTCVVCLMVAGRLGSPMISILEVGVVVAVKGFVRRMENSPEGGGAMERGIVVDGVCRMG